MKIALDVMGFENPISEAIKAAKKFIKKHKDVSIVLVGNQNLIEKHIKKTTRLSICHAEQVIKMTDDPISALRNQKTSMFQAINLVANNTVDGVLSAGNTNCFVPMVYTFLGLIKGIQKPAFMPCFPTTNKRGFIMLDVGANKNASANDLIAYAKMGEIYCKTIKKIASPKVGIINIGTEMHKGFDFQQQANAVLLKDKQMNYLGFQEPRDLLQNSLDVAVCDGYTGNIALKSMEGSLKALSIVLKKSFQKPWNWLGALFSILSIHHVKHVFDYKNNAGAMVIGLKKAAVKTHGSADWKQFYSSLKMLKDVIEKSVISQIEKCFNND